MRNSCWFFLYYQDFFIWIINICNSSWNLCALSVIFPHPLIQWTISRVRLGYISVSLTMCPLPWGCDKRTHKKKVQKVLKIWAWNIVCLSAWSGRFWVHPLHLLSFYYIWRRIFLKNHNKFKTDKTEKLGMGIIKATRRKTLRNTEVDRRVAIPLCVCGGFFFFPWHT